MCLKDVDQSYPVKLTLGAHGLNTLSIPDIFPYNFIIL